jgi:hypothetical protein
MEEREGLCVCWKVTKETRRGHLISTAVSIATDSNGEKRGKEIISKMDHHTLIRREKSGRHSVCEPIAIAIEVLHT